MTTSPSSTFRHAARNLTTPDPDQTTLLPDTSTAETRPRSLRIGYLLAVKMALVAFALSALCYLVTEPRIAAPYHDQQLNLTKSFIVLFLNVLFFAPLLETSIFHFGYKFVFSLTWKLTNKIKLILYIILSDFIFFALHFPKKSLFFVSHSFTEALVAGFVGGSIFSLTYYKSVNEYQFRPYLTTAFCHAFVNGLLIFGYFLVSALFR